MVRVINYAGVEPWTGTVTFAGPDPAAQQESWTLFCELPEGTSGPRAGVRGPRRAAVA